MLRIIESKDIGIVSAAYLKATSVLLEVSTSLTFKKCRFNLILSYSYCSE